VSKSNLTISEEISDNVDSIKRRFFLSKVLLVSKSFVC